MSLISIHLSKQVRFVYSDHLGRRKPWLELILAPVLANCATLAPTSDARRLFQSSLRDHTRYLSIPIVYVIAFWGFFRRSPSFFESGGVLAIVNMLGASQNVYFGSRDFALLGNDLTKRRFAPAPVIFSIKVFRSFLGEHHETLQSEKYIFLQPIFF